MMTSRRSALVGAGSILLAPAAARAASAESAIVDDVAAVASRSYRANAALMRGDLAAYRSLLSYTDDFSLMSPFGGEPTLAAQLTEERMQALGRFFRQGTFAQEVIAAYAVPGMVVLVTVERANVEVGGLPAQDWALRVTQAYRREGGDWRLAHRHADPLVAGVSLNEAAALGRR